MRCWSVLLLLSGLVGCGQDLKPSDLAADRDGDGADSSVDCDDGNAAIYPGATEVCGDGVDNDCDGAIDDEGIGAQTWYLDEDHDGYGVTTQSTFACASGVGEGWSAQSGDCDDHDPKAYPGATEICDDIDQNCDGTPDDGLVFDEFWIDGDEDGYGDANTEARASCAMLDGWVTNGDDCDDTRADVHPGVLDVCDGLDNDCAGGPDNAASASIGSTLYTTIDDAIDAAVGSNQVIDVCVGTHRVWTKRSLDVSEGITLVGVDRDLTVVEIMASGAWVTLGASASLEVSGLEATGIGPGTSLVDVGSGGIFTLSDARLTAFPTPAIQAVDVVQTAQVTLSGSEVVGTGRALLVVGGVAVDIDDTWFEANTVLDGGEAVVRIVSTPQAAPGVAFADTTFFGNESVDGIVRIVADYGTLPITATMTDTELVDNRGTRQGALYVAGVDLVGTNLAIRGGYGMPDQGGGLTAIDSTVDGVLVDDCEAVTGGGIYAQASIVHHAEVTNCRATDGGGIASVGLTRIVWPHIADNVAIQGGGVYMLADFSGGGWLDAGTVEDNQADQGGGVYFEAMAPGLPNRLGSVLEIFRNQATISGPGLHVESGDADGAADFGLAGDPLTDNGDLDISWIDGGGVLQEVDMEYLDWSLRSGVFELL